MFTPLTSYNFFNNTKRAESFYISLSREEESKSFADFAQDLSNVYANLSQLKYSNCILYVEDAYTFFVVFMANALAGKSTTFPANNKVLNIEKICLDESLYISDTPQSHISLMKLFQTKSNTDILKNLRLHPETELYFYTSGSTGEPKLIGKKIKHIDAELLQLYDFFHESIDKSLFTSTVYHHHFFGFIFYLLLPFCMGLNLVRQRILQPEMLNHSLISGNVTLIGSPAFYQRAHSIENPETKWFLFSSTGLLLKSVYTQCLEIFKLQPNRMVEIYGSTEAGSVANRVQGHSDIWDIFPVFTAKLDNSSVLILSSAYFDEKELATGDIVSMEDKNHFSLIGRIDSIIKVEGKRINTLEIDNKIKEHEFFADSYTLFQKTALRDQLVSFVVMHEDVDKTFAQLNTLEKKQYIRRYLDNYFERVLQPKKIFFLKEIPYNTMGKINKNLLKSIADIHSVQKDYSYTLETLNESMALVKLLLPQHSAYFDGHFDNFQILPAVIQLKLALDISQQLFQHDLTVKESKKMKFINMICPNQDLFLKLELDFQTSQLSFTYFFENTKYSAGKILLTKIENKV